METKVKKFIIEFPNRNWSPSTLNKLPTTLHQTSRVRLQTSSGKKPKMRIAQNVDSVEELALSRKNAGHFQIIRQIQ